MLMVMGMLGKVFGTKNDKEIKRYKKRVKKINALESTYEAMDDASLQEAFGVLRQKVSAGEATLDAVLEESFALTREASKRILNMRHFDVQLIGGMVLHDGRIAEMKTGEGKTLVATLPVVLNAMQGDGVHVVTVNDYLARRDAEQLSELYSFFGLTTGILLENEFDAEKKASAYMADITYGTNNEFGFDYLRDNMSYSKDQMAQRQHAFVIVDEVDSILIDEARTPLIISGPANREMMDYIKADGVAKKLTKETHFTVDEKDRLVLITEEGIAKAEELFGVENLYSIENSTLSHQLDNALKANYLFEIDVDYVIKEGEVVIVDEFTGRLSEGRRFSEGLHQALEAKEGVEIKEETQTLADITFQNYFRMYNKLSGMTGTAQTEATEFAQIYKLDVISIPTNVPITRNDMNDLIYKTEDEKHQAVIKKVLELHTKGQPILIGTASIEKSEELHQVLKKEKITHTVLNAKNHEQEGEIIKQAGAKGAVTIATNMAGRGVDIKIDDEVKALGGLAIIGTERHENRRIDNQLRGRAGRQGDPGSSQFFLSLEDNLLRIFGSDRIKVIMDRLGVEEGDYIESKMVTRAVEKAQKKVENMHFEGRKQIVEYDDVANEQRKIIYKFRNELLAEDFNMANKIEELRENYLHDLLHKCDIVEGLPSEEFQFEKLMVMLQEELNLQVAESYFENSDVSAIYESLYTLLHDNYESKMQMIDEVLRLDIEREIYLKTLDNAWRNHLYQMDNMKTGIRLRAYNQKDPLVEYKKESFNLFSELVESIKLDTIKTLHIIQFKVAQEEAEAFAQKMQEEQEEQLQQFQSNMQESGNEVNSDIGSGKKIARNEPCPCGSGKKYKHCHGKSGPKKGAFAS